MSSEVPIFIQVDSGSDVEAMALGHVTVEVRVGIVG